MRTTRSNKFGLAAFIAVVAVVLAFLFSPVFLALLILSAALLFL